MPTSDPKVRNRATMIRHTPQYLRRLPLLHRPLTFTAVSSSPATKGGEEGCVAEMAISHPWPEWVDFMERLLRLGYLESPLSLPSTSADCKAYNQVRTACLNFARDRSHLFQHLPKRDILVMVRHGCPNLDRKVVNSAKRLRAFLDVEEANVCCSCELRGRCERAYARNQENDVTTADVMRVLLTFGLDLITESVDSNMCRKENVKVAARKLLNSILECSTREPDPNVQEVSENISSMTRTSCPDEMPSDKTNAQLRYGDWICLKCNFLNFSKNIRCLRCNEASQEKLRKLRDEHEHLPLKRGDWICTLCNFLNFARNSVCMQCNEKPTNRQLNTGEWECPSCNFINFRRNELCLRCGWKRPKANQYEGGSSPGSQHNIHSSGMQPAVTFPCNGHKLSQQHPKRNYLDHEDSAFWSSAEDGSDTDDACLEKQIDFEDFPIVGGKSLISRDPFEKQKWREARMRRCKTDNRTRVECRTKDVACNGYNIPRLEYRAENVCNPSNGNGSDDNDDDDDEMSGWFRQRR